jgi:hypothetical protein
MVKAPPLEILTGFGMRIERNSERVVVTIRHSLPKGIPQGLKCVRENQAIIATERNSGRWVEDGCIEKQQVSAASRHGKLASQRQSPVLTLALKSPLI